MRFDREYPPIPWVSLIYCRSRGGNNWRLLKRGEQWDGPMYADHPRYYAYDPGWQDRLPVKWYARAFWREHSVGPIEADSYLGAVLKALWGVAVYRLYVALGRPGGDMYPWWYRRLQGW